MSGHDLPLKDTELTEAISVAMVDLYGRFYGHDRITGTAYINDNVVLCILSTAESDQIADGHSGDVIDGRVAFQVGAEDEFTATIERVTGRSVTAFLSSTQTSPGIASELFSLQPPPVLAA
jgi:hypothetical protein